VDRSLSTTLPTHRAGGHPAIKILDTWLFKKPRGLVMMCIYCVGVAMPTILKTVLN
jgi:hypothetical protein